MESFKQSELIGHVSKERQVGVGAGRRASMGKKCGAKGEEGHQVGRCYHIMIYFF